MKPKRRKEEGGEPFKWILSLCLPVEYGKVDLALPLGSLLYRRLTTWYVVNAYYANVNPIKSASLNLS